MPLSTLLREGTKASHRAAESTPFVQAFLAGRVSAAAYRELLMRLYQVYTALEHGLAHHAAHPLVGGVHTPALIRTPALEADLHFFYGAGWRTALQPTPATTAYVDRLQTLTTDWPLGLVAHHYTRYLGDLSGGQALKRIAARTFHLADGDGVAFYEFPAIPDHQRFKTEYRARLDGLALTPEEADQLVAEANRAFAHNTEVFAELLAPV